MLVQSRRAGVCLHATFVFRYTIQAVQQGKNQGNLTLPPVDRFRHLLLTAILLSSSFFRHLSLSKNFFRSSTLFHNIGLTPLAFLIYFPHLLQKRTNINEQLFN